MEKLIPLLKQQLQQLQQIEKEKNNAVKAQYFKQAANLRDKEKQVWAQYEDTLSQCQTAGQLIVLRMEGMHLDAHNPSSLPEPIPENEALPAFVAQLCLLKKNPGNEQEKHTTWLAIEQEKPSHQLLYCSDMPKEEDQASNSWLQNLQQLTDKYAGGTLLNKALLKGIIRNAQRIFR